MRGFRLKRAKNTAALLGDRARDARDWSSASRHYREALDQNSNNPAIWVQYGHALKESGQVAEAESAYRKSLELAPHVADTHLQLGHVLKIEGRKDEAVTSYLRALALDPTLHHASLELLGLGWTMACINEWTMARISRALRRENALIENRNEGRGSADQASSIVFDISDLVEYFEDNRLPTGIQRVQIEVLTSLLRKPQPNFAITIACLTRRSDFWVAIPEALFLELAELAVAGGKTDEPVWRGALGELHLILYGETALVFCYGAILINMGTSWWLPDYFLMVRQAKEEYGISYVPFVHDCIPVMVPEHCVPGLVRDFTRWILAVFFHADQYLVNSQATAKDLATIAELLGHTIPQPNIVRLDARFSADRDITRQRRRHNSIIKRHGLTGEPFVLFVGTIETRKNHLLAFNVWLMLLKKRGVRNTPMLVCVGKPGWLMEGAMARLKSSELLQRKVLILSTVGDDELAELYRHCLFTVFPSLYEGWGLPVTEALCYGKVPLTTAVSSLPEAGGALAEYFDHHSERDMLEKLERLIDDEPHRSAREAEIRRQFAPRSWDDIADQITESVLSLVRTATGSLPVDDQAPFRGTCLPPAETGRYYSMSRNSEVRLRPGAIFGEMYRMGLGWYPPEDWGVWLKPGVAEIAFSLPTARSCPHLVYLGLVGNPVKEAEYRLQVMGSGAEEAGTLHCDEVRWVLLDIGADLVQHDPIRIRFETRGGSRLSDVNEKDERVVTAGMLGFCVCPEDDLLARHSFVEAVQLNRLDGLHQRIGNLCKSSTRPTRGAPVRVADKRSAC
jgi:glycosyltransferase involved in cell wall biosynthesis